MEVMVSRYDERASGWPPHYPQYSDMVTAWTPHGTFTMRYQLWLLLFGIELERFTERRLVKLPIAAVLEQERPVERKA